MAFRSTLRRGPLAAEDDVQFLFVLGDDIQGGKPWVVAPAIVRDGDLFDFLGVDYEVVLLRGKLHAKPYNEPKSKRGGK